jgi:hypothetical protein
VSANAKRLDEIDARIAAATPGPWRRWAWAKPKGGWGKLFRGYLSFGASDERIEVVHPDTEEDHPSKEGNRCVAISGNGPTSLANAALIAHAPADIALLSRIVRMVADGKCPHSCDCGCDGELFDWRACAKPDSDDFLCWPCRVRRELGGGR